MTPDPRKSPPRSPAFRLAVVLAAAVSTGALVALALPDTGWWPLAFVAWVPLLVVVPDLSPGRAFLAGWLSGAVARGAVFHWIVYTAMTMSDFPSAAAGAVTVAYALGEGVPAGLAALAARAALRGRLGVLVVPAAAVAAEWVWPDLFPWRLGHAMFRVPLMLQGLDLVGVSGLSFVAYAANAALALATRSVRGGAAARRAAALAVGVAAALAAAWIAYGAARLDEVRSRPAAGTLRLALVQPNVTADERRRMNGKGSTSDLRRTLIARSEELTRSADLSGVDAVVWPEGGFYFLFGPDDPKYPVVATESRKLVEFVRDLGRPVIFGSLTSPAGKPRNSLVLLRPDGTWQTYDKRRLLAFGEHLPLSETFPSLKGSIPGVGELEPGTGPVAFPLAATSADGRPMTARALASICYEAILPDLTRESVVDTGADVIVNVTNDVWFGPEGEPAQHLMLQAVRAVELRIPLVRVTQTGITAVVLPSGDFAAETAVGERRVVTVDVPFGAPSDTLYRSIGEAFPVACLLGVVAFLAVPWARRRLRSV